MFWFYCKLQVIPPAVPPHYLVIKASGSRANDLGFDSHLRPGDFSRSSHTSDFKIGAPVATLPGAWRHRVSAGTGWHCVSILRLGEMESLICNFYLSKAARKLVCLCIHLSVCDQGRRERTGRGSTAALLQSEERSTSHRHGWVNARLTPKSLCPLETSLSP